MRISEKQLPKYYHMLPPICEKLGIEVPELYLTMDGSPNAYTAGDTKPFIVMTTGLLKSLPEELIPTVLAHECGHIACHHVPQNAAAHARENAHEQEQKDVERIAALDGGTDAGGGEDAETEGVHHQQNELMQVLPAVEETADNGKKDHH